jgi:G3E family GTPase
VLVLNKLDLVTAEEADEVEARLRTINPLARIIRATRADVPVTELLHQNAFDLDRILSFAPDFLESDEHGHTEGVYSMSIEAKRPIVMQKFREWIGTLLQEKGGDLLRTKGILHIEGEQRRFAFQAVHMMADGDFISPGKDGTAASRLVFIGRDLNRPQLRRGFEACQVPA